MVKIVWSKLANDQLLDIFDYYSKKASKRIAKKIVTRIADRVDILIKNPQIGQVEELLIDYPIESRYLVEGNYKIIYWNADNIITIAAVFDCRLNPEKMRTIHL